MESSNSHLSLFISAKSLLRVKNWLKCIKDFFFYSVSKKPLTQYIMFRSSLSLSKRLWMAKEIKEQFVAYSGVIFQYGEWSIYKPRKHTGYFSAFFQQF